MPKAAAKLKKHAVVTTAGERKSSRHVMPKVYWFTYHALEREVGALSRTAPDYSRSFHQVRDGAAFAELYRIVAHAGYDYGGIILNLPHFDKTAELGSLVQLRSTDLVVLVTRPPLSDRHTDKRRIERSNTPIETDVLKELASFFDVCSRGQVTLGAGLVNSFPETEKSRGDIEFSINKNACYSRQWVDSSGLTNEWQSYTAGYLALSPHAWDNGPRLLCAFGMGGIETLDWCSFLAGNDAENTLEVIRSKHRTFAFAEWQIKAYPARPLHWPMADRCRPRLVHVAKQVDAQGGSVWSP